MRTICMYAHNYKYLYAEESKARQTGSALSEEREQARCAWITTSRRAV